MNEFHKQKSEAQKLDSIFSNERSRAQKLLDECKQEEKKTKLIPVKFGINAIYLVSEAKAGDIDAWKKEKSKAIEKLQKLYH
jgi:hypothetical protein